MLKTLPDNACLRTLLFRISRNGHTNVSPRERLAALQTLNDWIDNGRRGAAQARGGKIVLRRHPATGDAPIARDAHADAGDLTHAWVDINGVYGNVAINAQAEDFDAVGIKPFMWLEFKVGERTERIRYGRDFSSVKHGEWVVFPYADGYCWIARNYENAAASIGLKEGEHADAQLFDDAAAP